jgi:DNA repair protein RecO (recombination protein O)
MRRKRDECYVLETLELGEADLIVTLLGREAGKVRAVAPGARRSRRRFGGALEPLTRVAAEWVEREARDLHRLESVDCLRSFAAMQADPELQATCAVLVELTRTFGSEGQAEPADFRLIGAVLEALERGGDPPTLLRYFEYWLLRIHGLLPDFAEQRFAAAERAALLQFATTPPAELTPLAAARRGGTLECLLRGALEAFAERPFRSYRHLGQGAA